MICSTCATSRYAVRQRPDAVQRRRKRNQPIPRHPPITSHHRRNPHKAPGCRIDPPVSVPSAATARPAATAAAEPPLDPPGTRSSATGFFTGPYAEFSVRAAHGEFVAIRLAQNHRARRLQPDHGRRVIRRDVVVQNLRAAGGAHAARADHILNCERHARQRRQWFPRSNHRVHAIRLRVGALLAQRQVRIQLRIARRNPLVMLRGNLPRRSLLRRNRFSYLINRPIVVMKRPCHSERSPRSEESLFDR